MRHCCETMTRNLEYDCDLHEDPFDCGDAVVFYSAKFDEYGLIIHDGGSSTLCIEFCPWCGTRLPPSQRDAWFDEMERRGIDPWDGEVPPEFTTSAWRLSAGG
ncbi:hypothetical protein J4573_30290 [Actinomadura barringtoniae]|uniref:DUF6980 domain-containing protein n=1 Tax=Actinomadura barringtoniae TaxID=1427535 RepID=A0A939PLL9_9ACTN|nr:hypothetical protein [Actinomadura barringtoniae]